MNRGITNAAADAGRRPARRYLDNSRHLSWGYFLGYNSSADDKQLHNSRIERYLFGGGIRHRLLDWQLVDGG
jgi:hypothetical protein